ncbi:hypothetical protein [Xanthomonas campestris]|uniref:hypothetical protein n=1 Tax=Xanthomonas campestris TaxID=339 RepID=UPI000E1E42A5|nr:hypothetical protein [Xanthomonas campestris]
MTRHLARRAPKRERGLCWGRTPNDNGTVVTSQLFRRDHRGALHTSVHVVTANHSLKEIADCLRTARHALRNKVDSIDLEAMEVAP